MEQRSQEVSELMKKRPEEIIRLAGEHLIVCKDLDALYHRFAQDIAKEISKNNSEEKVTNLILPIGPVEQYPILAEIITNKSISLKKCSFFFMDEYCDNKGKVLPSDHPLSFKGIAETKFFDKLPKISSDFMDNIYFPNEKNIGKIENIIKQKGGISTSYGGIGIHGHLAFNEPDSDIKNSMPRKVKLNEYTITINSIRAEVGGNVENFPKEAYTLGMTQILNSERIRLYCRNGTPYDWANTILRIALLGTPEDDYPVTHIRNHKDYIIITDWDTLRTPKNQL